jgi:hypothetical protein
MYAVITLMFSEQSEARAAKIFFIKLFPEFERDTLNTVRDYLNNGKGQLVMFWLLIQTSNERLNYADTINTWLAKQSDADNLSLNLHLLLNQTEQANALALQMLNNDWLPSPNDDFYIAERHPLWQALSPQVWQRIKANQRQALGAVALIN